MIKPYIYYIEITTLGHKEQFCTMSLNKARNKIIEVLQATSLTFNPKMHKTVRTVQKRMKERKINENYTYAIENSVIQITLIKRL
jgi:hypothetical protein